ncbi:hypothetical protein [Helicobacter sp. T3_23-1059]
MKNKIDDLRDYAELAQASYFYFDLLKDSNGNPRKIYELDFDGKKIKDANYPRGYKEIQVNLEHIVSKKCQEQEVLANLEQDDDIFTKTKNEAKDAFNMDKLNGEFGELQTKHFFKKYELLLHQHNTNSGFSATLFQNKQTKDFTLAIRSTK